jgi:hypothetical protein
MMDNVQKHNICTDFMVLYFTQQKHTKFNRSDIFAALIPQIHRGATLLL